MRKICEDNIEPWDKSFLKHTSKMLEYDISYIQDVFNNALAGSPLKCVVRDDVSVSEEYYHILGYSETIKKYHHLRTDIKVLSCNFTVKLQDSIHQFRTLMYTEFTNEYGELYLNGTRYQLVPVLVNNALKPLGSKILFWLAKRKFFVIREELKVLIDGKVVPSSVLLSDYFKNYLGNNTRKHAPIVLYPLIQNGLWELVSKYNGDIKLVFKNRKTVIGINGVMEYTQLDTEGYKLYTLYGFDLVIMVKNSNDFLYLLITSILYIYSKYPNELFTTLSKETSTGWKMLLGLFTFNSNTTLGVILDRVEEHIQTNDNQISPKVLKDLSNIDVLDVTSFADLMEHTLANYLIYTTPQSLTMEEQLKFKRYDLLVYTTSYLTNMLNMKIPGILKEISLGRGNINKIIKAIKNIIAKTASRRSRYRVGVLPIILNQSTSQNWFYIADRVEVQDSGKGYESGGVLFPYEFHKLNPDMCLGVFTKGMKSRPIPQLYDNPHRYINHQSGSIKLHPKLKNFMSELYKDLYVKKEKEI